MVIFQFHNLKLDYQSVEISRMDTGSETELRMVLKIF